MICHLTHEGDPVCQSSTIPLPPKPYQNPREDLQCHDPWRHGARQSLDALYHLPGRCDSRSSGPWRVYRWPSAVSDHLRATGAEHHRGLCLRAFCFQRGRVPLLCGPHLLPARQADQCDGYGGSGRGSPCSEEITTRCEKITSTCSTEDTAIHTEEISTSSEEGSSTCSEEDTAAAAHKKTSPKAQPLPNSA